MSHRRSATRRVSPDAVAYPPISNAAASCSHSARAAQAPRLPRLPLANAARGRERRRDRASRKGYRETEHVRDYYATDAHL